MIYIALLSAQPKMIVVVVEVEAFHILNIFFSAKTCLR